MTGKCTASCPEARRWSRIQPALEGGEAASREALPRVLVIKSALRRVDPNFTMQIPPIGTLGTLMIGLIILASLLAVALVPAQEYACSVRWHDLRVRCQRLRRNRLLTLLERGDLEDATPSTMDSAAIEAATGQSDGQSDGQTDGQTDDEGDPGSAPGIAGRIGGSGAAPAQARAA